MQKVQKPSNSECDRYIVRTLHNLDADFFLIFTGYHDDNGVTDRRQHFTYTGLKIYQSVLSTKWTYGRLGRSEQICASHHHIVRGESHITVQINLNITKWKLLVQRILDKG
jgi:hypothetical protein